MAQSFNEVELLERLDNDIGFLAETVEMLATDGRELIVQIRQALSGADAPRLGSAAHTLKGMVSNFCAPQVQADAFDLERIGKSGDLAAAAPVVGKVEREVDALIVELTAFVKARS